MSSFRGYWMVRLPFLLPLNLLQSVATGGDNYEARVSGLTFSVILLEPLSHRCDRNPFSTSLDLYLFDY